MEEDHHGGWVLWEDHEIAMKELSAALSAEHNRFMDLLVLRIATDMFGGSKKFAMNYLVECLRESQRTNPEEGA